MFHFLDIHLPFLLFHLHKLLKHIHPLKNLVLYYEKADRFATNLKVPNISEKEQKYQELWKMFFKTIAISERKNPRCQMQYMPKKYWKDLVEEP